MNACVITRTKSFAAGGALGQYLRVKLSGGQLALAGATDYDCIGSTERPAFNAGDPTPINLLTAQGTIIGVAAAVFAQGAELFAAANGQISNVGTISVGIALDAATAQGDYVEYLPRVQHAPAENASFTTLSHAAVAAAGPVTLTGAQVGQQVMAIIGAPTAGGALVAYKPGTDFEAAISVANQIQQLSAADLHLTTIVVILGPVATT